MAEAAASLRLPRPLGGESVLRTVLYMAVAVTFFPFLNASVKYLGRHYPMPEIFWARYAGHVFYCLLAFCPRHGLTVFRTGRPVVHAWRSLLLFGASACYFLGLQTISLPTASAIDFVGPILVTALSVPMLGEKVGPRRWTAIVLGFIGALVIIRPGTDVVQWGAVLVLIDVFFYAIYQILSRKVANQDPAVVSITLAGLGGLAISSLILPLAPLKLPVSFFDGAVFAGVGFFGLAGHFFVVKAMQWGTASLVSTLSYGGLVGATILGYFLFGDFPDLWTWLGAAIIIASGLFIIRREHALQRARCAPGVRSQESGIRRGRLPDS
jgi:drug/metabolite transporter (DMT)-like permease